MEINLNMFEFSEYRKYFKINYYICVARLILENHVRVVFCSIMNLTTTSVPGRLNHYIIIERTLFYNILF